MSPRSTVAAADRSDDADGHADGDEDDGREDRQRERVGEAGEEDLTHRASGAEGEPEARRTAVDHVAGVGEVAAHEQSTEVLGELLPQRTVEPEVGPDRRQLLFVAPRLGTHRLRRVRRTGVEEQECRDEGRQDDAERQADRLRMYVSTNYLPK